MPCLDLHLDCPGLRNTDFSIDSENITVDAEPSGATALCPDCRCDSERGLSRNARHLTHPASEGRLG